MGKATARSPRLFAAAVVATLATSIGWPAHATPLPSLSVGASLVDLVVLDSHSTGSVDTTIPLRAGHEYAIDAVGAFGYDGYGAADAECSTARDDNVYRPWRYVGAFGNFSDDLLDVYVNGKQVDWKPVSGSGRCDTVTHHYEILFTPDTTGPVTFSIKDPYHGDNSGSVAVSVYFIGGVADASGSIPSP